MQKKHTFFWSTFARHIENFIDGHTVSKETLTILLSDNIVDTHKHNMLVIGKKALFGDLKSVNEIGLKVKIKSFCNCSTV